MNSIRLGAVAAVFVAGQALAQNSQISYELELNGDNHAADWKNPPGCGSPTPFTPGVTTDGLVFPAGSKITWAARATVSGTHSDGFVPSGIANIVFSLELRKDGELVSGFGLGDDANTPGFYSTINDGTARGCLAPSDPLEAAAFAVNYRVDPDNYPIYGRLIDSPMAGGPLLDYFQYPSVAGYPAGSTAASGTLQGVGAGYSKFVSYGCPIDCGGGLGFNVAGVGRDVAAVGGCGSKLGNGVVIEGQLNLTGLPAGTYTLALIPGTGNNILSGNFNCTFGDPGKFAAKPDLPTQGDTITFVIEGGAAEPAQVVNVQLFYKGSFFDTTPVPNKTPLRSGTATFDNVSSYSRGINGMYIDIANLANPGALSAADFVIRAGNSTNIESWGAGPAPETVTVQAGAGVNGSDRVVLTWPDWNPSNPPGTLATRNWMEVTVLANANTGLAQPDVFYWGLLVGEVGVGNTATQFRVNNSDYNEVYNMRAGAGTTPLSQTIESVWDFDHNRTVNNVDYNLSYNQRLVNALTDRLNVITVP